MSVLLGMALLAGCGQESSAALLASAKDYLAKKDSRAAVIQLKSALQKQPDLAEARFLLGQSLLSSGDAVSAEIELRKALDLKYPAAVVVPVLAWSLVLQGKGQQVIHDFASTDLGQPAATAELKTVLSTAFARQGDNVKARAALEEALRADPDFAKALLAKARMKASDHDPDAAFALIERVIAKEPDNFEALHLKGVLLLVVKGDEAAALDAQRQALAKRPDWLPSYESILEILLARHDLAAARIQIDQMKKALPNYPQTRYFEGRLAVLNKDYKTAHEIAQQLLAIAPDNLKFLLLASTVDLQTGSLAQAEGFAARALQQAPDSVPARRLLGLIDLRSGQPLRAQEVLKPLLDRPDVDALTLDLAAEAALQLGDATNAEAYFGRAAKLSPNDATSRTALAMAQLSSGNADVGLAQLQEIASSDKGSLADMALISNRLRQRDYPAALKAIDSLERKQPDKPVAAQLRGQVQLARRDIAAARQSFERALAIDPLYFPAATSLASLDMRDGKPDDARKRFDKLLAADPKDLRALLAIVELRARTGASKDEISSLLANAIRLNPTNARPRLVLIEMNLRAADTKAALAAAEEGVAALPASPELLEALGRAQLASGSTEQAISSFNKFAALQPKSPQPLLRLAEADLATKNWSAAREHLNHALELAPKFLPAQKSLILLELSAGRPEQAMAAARAVQKARPDESVGYLFAGDIDAYAKNWGAAEAEYRAGLERGGSAELASKLHGMLVAEQKKTDADAFAATWVKAHPQDAAFRNYLGNLALTQLDFAGAETQYLAVVALSPENAIALNNLAWITNKLKKPGAMAYAERANALRPGEPSFMDTMATILADAGQLDKALELEKKAVALAPDNDSLRLELAKLHLKAGDKKLAKIELDRLAKRGDKFAGQAEVGELLKAL